MDFRSDQTSLDLAGTWHMAYEDADANTLRAARRGEDILQAGITAYRATVPGNFELDLHANGLIEEPFFSMNIAGLTRYERTRVAYWRDFQAPEMPELEAVLEFQGIDCFATIYVNGVQVGQTDNMLIAYRFPLSTDMLQPSNEILVVIEPPLQHASADDYPRLLQAMPANYESLRTRKAPHMYGWDIMPRALSAGIWRPVRILYLPPERIESLYLETIDLDVERRVARMHVHYALKLADHPHSGYELQVEGHCGEKSFSQRHRVLYEVGAATFEVSDARIWWPRGRGEQNLYECSAVLLKNGQPLDRVTFRTGIRTAQLLRTDVTDEGGSGEFCFVVNGERVFVLGTNWVPLDAYHSRDIQRVDAAIELVKEVGCNMIRCWGGNVYESDRFFDLCDEAGILVWQDFAMACAIYPQDAEFQDVLRREAQAIVQRLRQHPSLVLWAGDNECDYSYLWGTSGLDPNTNVLTRKVLPQVIREEDPRRPYLPSSPYIAPEAYRKGTRYLPEDHLWGPRDYYKGAYYQSSLCHFASEIGYHGCPSVESMRRFLSPEALWPYHDNPEWKLHATSPIPGVDLFDYRVELMAKQVRVLFGRVPEHLNDFVYASQASQAEAMKFFIEMFRSQKWRRTGIIWWNILDGWPQFSDAVVDYYFVKKRAFDTIRRSQQPIVLVFREPEGNSQELVVCNDTRCEVRLRFVVTDAMSQEVLLEGGATAGADCVTVVGEVPVVAGAQRMLLVTWRGDEVAGWNYYLAGEPPFDLNWYRSAMEALGDLAAGAS